MRSAGFFGLNQDSFTLGNGFSLRNAARLSFKEVVRPILSLLLVAVTLFLVSCGGTPTEVKTTQYSAADLEQIQRYTTDIQELRDRLLEIPPAVRQENWRDIQTLIHGPLGELRFKMSNVTRFLNASVQEEARSSSKNVFEHLVKIDEASEIRDSRQLLKNYNGVLEDFDAFLSLIPKESAE
jgi:photosystem II protein PsbQ